MPFTANRQFKANPRLLARAKGMYYTTADGRESSTVSRDCGA
jgi:beta-alanine--pyruvate transaminase